MPCDVTRQSDRQTATEREGEVSDALGRLEEALRAGEVVVRVGPTGSVAFSGWEARSGMSDLCAYRRLATSGSEALRSALARAEATAGRQVDETAVAAGVHSHDGGKTWGKD